MLVSKMKPCMSQQKLLYCEIANGFIKAVIVHSMVLLTWIAVVILELIHAPKPDFLEGWCVLVPKPMV